MYVDINFTAVDLPSIAPSMHGKVNYSVPMITDGGVKSSASAAAKTPPPPPPPPTGPAGNSSLLVNSSIQ